MAGSRSFGVLVLIRNKVSEVYQHLRKKKLIRFELTKVRKKG